MLSEISFSEMVEEDFESWLKMSLKLWEDYEEAELRPELRRIFESSHQKVFIAKNAGREAIGFSYVAVRRDYVEGAEKSPTGYLEGIFVENTYRKHGIAKQLLKLGESWLKDRHCTQIGSDTWLWNKASQAFHKKIGFWEEEKLVHFLKDIDPGS